MGNATFEDGDGTARLVGTLDVTGTVAAGSSPSGATGAYLDLQPGGNTDGGQALLSGGTSPDGSHAGAFVATQGGANGLDGPLTIQASGSLGAPGEALVSDGANNVVYGGVIVAAGVPAGAPNGKLPIAIDTTAVTGGIYGWNGSAWVKAATI